MASSVAIPTAVQLLGPLRPNFPGTQATTHGPPGGVGSVRAAGDRIPFEVGVVDLIVHWLPSQCSMRVPAALPRVSLYPPVAVQFLAETQEIPVSRIDASSPSGRVRPGEAWTVHPRAGAGLALSLALALHAIGARAKAAPAATLSTPMILRICSLLS